MPPQTPATPHTAPRYWAVIHALVWLVSGLIIAWAVTANAPSPLWHWEGGRNPFLKINGQEHPIVALETPQGTHQVTPQWHGLPPHVQPTLTEKHRFEALEEHLITLEGQPLAWIDHTGQRWPIEWGPMGWAGIPTISWMLLLTSLITWHVAIWNLSVNPRDPTVRLYVLAGLGFTVGNLIRAWLSARPWGLPTLAWDFQFIVSHTCGLLFLGCLLLMVLRIPRPLISTRAQVLIGLGILAIELSDAFHLIPSRLMATYQWPMAALAVCVIAAQVWMAWRVRDDAAYSAALRWIVLVFAMAVLPPVILYGAWALGLIDTSLYDPVLIAPTLGYFAMSALLHRNRLLRLESWRSRTTSLWITCLVTLGLMITLLVRGDAWMGWALGVTALFLPWIYVVVRTVLTYRTPPSAPERLQELMPDVMNIAVAQVNREAISSLWLDILRKAFRPQRITTLDADTSAHDEPTGSITLSDDGLTLHVPHVTGGSLLLHADAGSGSTASRAQPFTPTDVELAEALWRLTSHGLLTKDSYEAGVKRERRRIAADLHDSIGGRLLHLSQTAASNQQRLYAINTLSDLRNITRGLSRDGGVWHQVLADLRHQMQRELDAVDVDLRWQCDWSEAELEQAADAEEAVALHCITSELVRNALQHARPTWLSVRWRAEGAGHHSLEVRHDGQVSDPSQWQHGLGVNSIRRRLKDRQGDSTWSLSPEGHLHFRGHWVSRTPDGAR